MGLRFRMLSLKSLASPVGLLTRLRRGIDFEAIDDQPVDIVVMLLLPETHDGASALACVARTLRIPKALQRIRDASDRDALFQAITET